MDRRHPNGSLSVNRHPPPVSLARPDPDLSEPAPPLWEQAAAIAVVVMLTQALIGPVFAPTQEETPILRLVWLPVYALTAALCLWRWERLVRVWPAILMLVVLVLHAFASKYWSIDPETTQRRVIALAITGAFSIYLGATFRGPHLPRLLMHAGLMMGIGSVIMVFAFPAIGMHQQDNAPLWRGLWYEKNQMGIVMVAAATTAAACLAADGRRWLLPALTLVLSAGLALATQSKTSLLCLIVGIGLVFSLWAMRRGGPAFTVVGIWVAVIVMAGVGYVAITDPAMVLTALGKDPSLTGRTDIWSALMSRVAEHPWTGYGYSAFWGKDSVPAAFIRQETQWPVPSAHNGWIDLLIQLGWPGAILTGAVVAFAAVATLIRIGGAGMREGYFGLAYLAVFLLLSMSESVLLSQSNLPWTLLLAILARAVAPGPEPVRIPLAPRRRQAYQPGSRIAAQYAHGQPRTHATPVR